MQLPNKEALATGSWRLQRAVLLRLQWASMGLRCNLAGF
jgi:hypothetical protein